MAGNRKKTGDVIAAARRDLKAQLKVVREEVGRLGGEERALTRALASLKGGGARPSSRAAASASADAEAIAKPHSRPRSARKASSRRRRRPRAASKSTAERVEELRGL